MGKPKQAVPPQWREKGLCYAEGLTLATAKRMIEAGEAEAKKQGLLMSIAVVDAGGHIVAFGRMDNAMLASIQIALDKAYTAAYGKLSTIVWRDILHSGELPPLFIHERWTAFPGGFPIVKGRKLVGGLGVSGATAYGDMSVAREALMAGGFSTRDADAMIQRLETEP
jgi:uncharacterized protein GlcG (DUF336 family)